MHSALNVPSGKTARDVAFVQILGKVLSGRKFYELAGQIKTLTRHDKPKIPVLTLGGICPGNLSMCLEDGAAGITAKSHCQDSTILPKMECGSREVSRFAGETLSGTGSGCHSKVLSQ
jgi:hypothetical protein